MDPHASLWPLELGIRTPTLRCGPSSWGDGLPRFGVAPWVGGDGLPGFGVAPRVGDTDPQASVWPLQLGIRTPTLRCGPLSWGYGLPRFGVAPRVGDTDSHASVWPLELRTPTLWCWKADRQVRSHYTADVHASKLATWAAVVKKGSTRSPTNDAPQPNEEVLMRRFLIAKIRKRSPLPPLS